MRARLATLLATAAVLLTLEAAAERPPNIVVLLADDVGFSDFGAYGSEVATPHIDALAAAGKQFGRFYVSPNCAPTRAMLLTGVSNHRAGVGNIPETLPPEQRGHPAYRGRLRDDVVTIASMLRQSGYRTYVTGKWHLGHTPDALPVARGFDRSFILDASGADNWEQRSYLPYYDEAPWFEDDAPARLPEDFYSSEFLIDRMIDYIGDEAGAQPFFAYVGFQAVHIPVQAPREFTDRYEGVYVEGWDALRRARLDGLIERGLLPADTVMGPMPAGVRAWEDLDADAQRYAARVMAVNAGMIEAMDHHIGRLIAHLEAIGEYERTLFVVFSDNGPEFNQPTNLMAMRLWLRASGYSTAYETLGERGSYAAIGPEWASAAASPGAFFKFHAGEGGIRVPLIIKGGDVRPGTTSALSFVTDLVPTLLELADVSVPDTVEGTAVQRFSGRSLAPLLRDEVDAVHGPDDVVAVEVGGNVALFKGDHKLVRNMPPYGDGSWQLYDIVSDPGETRDLMASHPTLAAELLAEFDAYAEREGVLPMPAGYEPMRQLIRATRERRMERNRPWIIAGSIAVAAFVLLGWSLARRRSRMAI